MNPSLSIDQLKQLKVIMQTMLSEACNANWQELSRLDSERRILIEYKAAATDSYKTPVARTSDNRHQPHDLKKDNTSYAPAGASAQGVHLPSAFDHKNTGFKADPEYLALSTELAVIDKEISDTVQKARQALLEQTRGLRAQVSAKKGYEQASIMKVSSYG